MGFEDAVCGSGFSVTDGLSLHRRLNTNFASKGQFARQTKCKCGKVFTTQKTANDDIVVKTREKIVSKMNSQHNNNYCRSCFINKAGAVAKSHKVGKSTNMATALFGSGTKGATVQQHYDHWAAYYAKLAGKFLSFTMCRGCKKKFGSRPTEKDDWTWHWKPTVLLNEGKGHCLGCAEKQARAEASKLVG